MTHPKDFDLDTACQAVRHPRSVVVFVLTVVVVLAADLISKHLAFQWVADRPIELTRDRADDPGLIPPHDQVPLVGHVLSLKLTTNTGAVFGLGQGAQWLFVGVGASAIVMITWVFARSPAGVWVNHLSLGLILAGALGNLYDRVRFNAVRDLLWLFPGVSLPFGWTWPGGNDELYPWIFNLADVALLVGMVLMLGPVLIRHDRHPPTEPLTPG